MLNFKIILLVLVLIIFPLLTFAVKIKVSVREKLDFMLEYFNYSKKSNLLTFQTVVYNPGSVGYKVRLRAEAFKEKERISQSWSKEVDLFPGASKTLNFHLYLPDKGNYSIRIRAYFGNEIEEVKNLTIVVNSLLNETFYINLKLWAIFPDEIMLKFKGEEANLLVLPYNFPSSWILEEKSIKEWKGEIVRLKFEGLFFPAEIKLVAVNLKTYEVCEIPIKFENLETSKLIFYFKSFLIDIFAI